MALMLTAVCGW